MPDVRSVRSQYSYVAVYMHTWAHTSRVKGILGIFIDGSSHALLCDVNNTRHSIHVLQQLSQDIARRLTAD